jgi:N-acetylmuramoyl-L-alanine amidase
MRKISELIWHCTATPEGREVLVGEVDRWHRDRGFHRSKPVGNLNLTSIGYHKLVHLDGSVSIGRDASEVGAHVSGHNTGTIGYCYVGGITKTGKSKDTRTAAQKKTMLALTRDAIANFGLTKVSGHHDYAAKDCPCFPAAKEYASLLPKK